MKFKLVGDQLRLFRKSINLHFLCLPNRLPVFEEHGDRQGQPFPPKQDGFNLWLKDWFVWLQPEKSTPEDLAFSMIMYEYVYTPTIVFDFQEASNTKNRQHTWYSIVSNLFQ